MLRLLKRKNPAQKQGEAFFEAALAQAKTYGKTYFVDDKPTDDQELRLKRFEAVALFMATILWRLKQDETMAEPAQHAYDTMFLSFDRSLREAGVGDIGVSHRIKKFAQAFHGRLKTYGDAFDQENQKELAKALENNMKVTKSEVEPLAKAAFDWAKVLKAKPTAELIK